jgi:hypothetical protein
MVTQGQSGVTQRTSSRPPNAVDAFPTAAREAMSALRTEGPVALFLAGVAILLAITAYGRWDTASWSVPLEYGNLGYDADAMAVLAQIKAAAQGDFPPFLTKNVRQLGAPFVGNWNDAPVVEQLLYSLAGCLAGVTSVFFAANALVVCSHALAAVGFYAVGRALGSDRRLCLAGGLVFAFARFPFTRQMHHPQVLYDWHVPACLLVGWWVLDGAGLTRRGRRFWIAVAIAVATGIQHPYYTNMFVQLTGLASMVQWARGRREAAGAGIAVCGAAMAAFLAMCGNYLAYKLLHGGSAAGMVRRFQWLEFYALKPLDLFMPPPDHRMPALAGLGRGYFENVLVPGEIPPSCYLGMIGIAALAWLTTVSVRRALAAPPRPLPAETWQVLWILAYSVIGGVNCLIGVFGIQLFRSANRYSIFILAIALLWAIRRLSRMPLSGRMTWGLSAAAVALALWDQVPPAPTAATIADVAARVDSDRTFTRGLESRLPQGAMIFQLPLMRYPEQPAPGVSASDHFRPFLYTDTLRFSFGSMAGRQDTAWQEPLLASGLRAAIEGLERYGFAALYINRAGYQDGAAELLKALAAMGRNETVASPRGDLVAVMLEPAAVPDLPPGLPTEPARVSPSPQSGPRR